MPLHPAKDIHEQGPDSGEFRLISFSTYYVFRCLHKRLVPVNKPISYSAYRYSFKKSFSDIVSDIAKFSTHSTRSEGATSAVTSGASERNIQRHGRWASVEAKNIYVKDSLASRLEVSKSLSL